MVFGNVRFHPLEHARNVLRAGVPTRASMPLHIHADHSVLGRPSHDVVVERVRFLILKLELVASASGNINQNRSRCGALVRCENIHDVFWIRPEGGVPHHRNAGIQWRGAARNVVGRHQRPVELRRARRIDDMPHGHQSRFDVGGDLGVSRHRRDRHRQKRAHQ